MSFVATAIIGAGVLGAGASIFGAYTQSQAEQKAQSQLAQQEGMTLSTINSYLQPYAQAGQNVLPTLQSLITPGPNQTATLNQLPGYQFAQDWGLKAVQNVQSTRGLGGNALAGGANFATGLAQQSFGQLAGLLQGYAGMGAQAAGTAAGTSAQTAGAFAPAIAQTTVGQGNALAGGATGAAGAIGGSVNQLTNLAILKNLIGGGMFGQQQNPGGGPLNIAPGYAANQPTPGWVDPYA